MDKEERAVGDRPGLSVVRPWMLQRIGLVDTRGENYRSRGEQRAWSFTPPGVESNKASSVATSDEPSSSLLDRYGWVRSNPESMYVRLSMEFAIDRPGMVSAWRTGPGIA